MQNKFKTKLNLDLKRLTGSALASNLSKHLTEYEAKVRGVVRDFDLKSREAREKSKQRLDEFTTQMKKTRTELEAKVSALVSKEGQRLNVRVAELVTYLKMVAGREKLAALGAKEKKVSKGRASKARGTKTASRKKRSASPKEAPSSTPATNPTL